MSLDEPAIQIDGLVKKFGSKTVLHGLTLSVPKGSIFGFLGPNGSGKTTTIKCLLGLLRYQGGTCRVLGIDPSRQSLAIRQRVGYMAENQTMYDFMTVKQIIGWVGRFYPSWDQSLADDLRGQTDLAPKAKVGQLSKGQASKLALLLALAPRPELVILDDPTLGLDPIARRDFMRDVIGQLQTRGVTVFFSSHLLYEIEPVVDWVCILHEGQVIKMARTDELRERVKRVLLRPPDGAVLAMFLGITSQVGNNLRVVESRCSQPGSLLTNVDHQVGPVLLGRTVVCATGGANLEFFKWTDDQRLVALWRPDLDGPEPRGTRELAVDIGRGKVRQLVPAGDDRLLVLVDRSTGKLRRRGFPPLDQLTLVCVQLSDSDRPKVTGEVLLWQRSPEDHERADVAAELAVSGRYGYLVWRHTLGQPNTELRVIDLSPQALGEVLATEQLGNFVEPRIRKVDDRLILGGESILWDAGRPRILEFDISDPSRPRRLAELPRLPEPELSGSLWRNQAAVLFDGQHLFMVDHGSLRVYALAPDGKSWELLGRRRAGFLETALGGPCLPVLRDNDRLYVHSWGFGLLVFDISDPSRPRRIAHWSYTADWQTRGVLPLGEFIALPGGFRDGRMLVAHRP